ncbi:hypothetical protein SASPL_127093 [Salvia splendens]|uniref:Uncharacterized protein n=1 Tax=Salvia splendens TaxID=180675 RepID=A0A8X8ZRS0_SALSN|nr:hypothetical protein SASPL_127093 [Salvia splendens]
MKRVNSKNPGNDYVKQPYISREVLNMVEACREIVAPLKHHRAAIKLPEIQLRSLDFLSIDASNPLMHSKNIRGTQAISTWFVEVLRKRQASCPNAARECLLQAGTRELLPGNRERAAAHTGTQLLSRYPNQHCPPSGSLQITGHPTPSYGTVVYRK